jgi:transposase
VAESRNVIHAQCWAHTRRKFIEAEGTDPPRSKKAIEYIRVLYESEAEYRGLLPEDHLIQRREVLLPLVEEFFTWLTHELKDLTILPSSPFSKAASYALQRRRELSVFLSDPAVPLDTNHLERALRVVPMGRKNWLFCWTEAGAHVVGKIQSLLVTCRLHGIDPYTCLVDVLQRVGSHKVHQVDELTPRLWKERFAAAPLVSDLVDQ